MGTVATSESTLNPSRGRLNTTLWIIQWLLTFLFLFAGGVKLVMSTAAMTKQMAGVPLPVWFLRFVGVCEVSGALGLILPGLTRIRTSLTPLAASGLVIIMIGATWVTVKVNGVLPALFPLIVGLFCAFVAYARWKMAPLRGSA
ncbi:MAG: DoxX family protein [Acidobacteriota bacterium]|nr:DoxX family protein [Acidobacteriota bacterium]